MLYNNKENNAQSSPLVSFIITSYNLETKLLRECIESVLALSLRPFEREIILVDDGSDIAPLEALGKLTDNVIYVRQKNAGLSCARNTGLRMAQGQYIQFVDGDDKLLSGPYEHCLDVARFTDIDIVMFDFTHAQKTPDVYEDQPILSGTELMRHQNLHGTACGYLFRQATLGELRFTPGIFHEDEEFTPQLLLRAEKVLRTNARAYYYRQRSSSIISNSDSTHIGRRLDNMRDVILRLNTIGDRLPQNERLAMQRRVHQLTMDFVYKVIQNDSSHTNERLEPLRQAGLFPLPDRDYTSKYKWFRRLSKSSLGMRVLKTIIPMTSEK